MNLFKQFYDARQEALYERYFKCYYQISNKQVKQLFLLKIILKAVA